MDEVVTEARSPNSAVRTHAFPALESGNMSFPEGRYLVGFKPGADASSLIVRHRIEGAALINDVIAEGLAQFVCTVAAPVSSYRVSHISESSTQVTQLGEQRSGRAADVHADGGRGGRRLRGRWTGNGTASTSSGTGVRCRSRGACVWR